jgi:hypothetical protein
MKKATQRPTQALKVKKGTSKDLLILYMISVKAKTGPIPPLLSMKGKKN